MASAGKFVVGQKHRGIHRQGGDVTFGDLDAAIEKRAERRWHGNCFSGSGVSQFYLMRTTMKRLIACLICAAVLPLGFSGCADTTEVKTEKKVTTPGGETTVTDTQKIEKTGDNPPPANP